MQEPMLGRLSMTLFFVTFCLLVILISLLSQKPQCFESKHIERITYTDNSFIDSCANRTQTHFSRKFELERQDWEKEVFSYENWVYNYWPKSKKKIHIRFYSHPQVPMKKDNEIQLWGEYSLNSWAIKRLITESILSEFITDAQMRSFLSDFYVRVWTQNQLVGYGDITSYFSYYWWKSYDQLTLKNKLKLLTLLAEQSPRLPSNKSHYDLLNQLQWIVDNNKSFSFLKLQLSQNHPGQFYDLSAKFDFLLMINKMTSNSLEQMDQLQKRFPNFRFGIWDGKVLYHVPSQSYLSAQAFRQIQADHYVWEICDDIEFSLLSQLPAEARKVLLVRNCGSQNLNVYASYFGGHTEKFAASHPNAEFIQFDVPSLNSQKDLLVNELKVFSLISNRTQFADLLTQLGWLSVNYDEKLRVHVPQSSVESIQYFRVKSDSL
jgi:hypothetical protein